MAQELDDLLRQREMASPAAARLRIQQAARAPGGADEAGRISETARRFNISPEVVRANPSMFDSTAASEDLAVQMARAPVLADWLNYRETNAQVGYGQLHSMSEISDAIRTAREARTPGDPAHMAPDEFARRLTYARQGQWEQYRQSVAEANRRILAARALNAPSAFANWLSGGDRPDSDGTLQGIARSIDSAIMGDQPVYPRLAAAYQAGDLSLGNIVRAAGAGVVDVGRGAIGVGESVAGVLEDYSPIAWAERQLFGHSLEGAVHQTLTTARHGTEDLANFIAPHAQSQAGQDILSGIRSLPLSAASLTGGLYLRSARAAATLSGVIVGGQSYGEARNAGLTPLRSMIFGATDAAVETLTELFPMHILIGETHAGSSFARRYVRSMLAEQGTEQIATVLQDFNQFISIDANNGKTFSQYLAERPQAALSTAIATAVGATVTNVGISAAEHVAQRFGSTLRQAATGAQTEQFLTRLAEMATASKVRERDAGSFADFVRMAAGGTGATDVYVDARQLAAVFEQGAISPEEASAMTGMAPQELAEAAARGDDVRIPIEQYATVIAPHEVNAQLMQHLRLDPDEMSPLEARTFMQDAVGQFAQEAENALAQGQQVDEARASMERVKESFVQQLNSANRFTPDVNNAYASMIASFYATMGSRLGVTAEQMAEKYQLQIKSEGVNAPSFDQSQRPAMINIGLDTNDGKGITKEEALSALKQAGVQVLSTDEHQSDSERTLVARLDRPLTPEEAHAVSVALKQEAIAQFAGGAGELHGPQAEKWQPFNPDYFLLPDGSRMSDAAYQQEAALEDAIPGLAHVLGTLTEEEREGLKAKKAAQLVAAFESLPSAEEMASVAFAGRAKRGWYERSASTLVDIFGIEDAPRFAALLAALSPQTSVESNLSNAIQMWINWSDAGRPTDRTAIENLMASSVQGEKGPGSVLGAWINNTVRALSTEATADIKLSGAKVNSFMLNLTGVVNEVTNDTWMANYAAIDSAMLGKGRPLREGRYGKSPTYLAMNAVVRRAAQIVTERTGETWTPAEVQETVWSWVKTLSEKRDEPGSTFAAEILAAGDLTHADIAGTPDFATLLLRGVYRGILEEGGYGDQLAAIDILEGLDSVEDEGSSAAPDGSPRPAGSVASAEGSGITAAAFLAHLEAAADRVDQLRGAGRPAAPGAGVASTYLQSKIESTLRADRASWTNDRFDQVLRAMAYQSVAGQENRSKGYVVMMSPDQYLGLTLSPKGRDVVAERVEQMEEYGLGELDQAKLAAAEPIYLIVVPGAPLEGGQRVMGHEGRHRMTLLKRAGVNEVPVVVRVEQPGDLVPLNDMKLLPQRAGRSDQLSSGDTPATVYNLQPMSWANRNNARRMATRDGIYFQDMIFYSALERAVEQSMTKKASAEQWIATLRKTPGVKQEELEWSGLLDFLAMQEGPVERDQLLELVRNGGIKVDEVLLGAGSNTLSYEVIAEPDAFGGEDTYTVLDDEGNVVDDGYDSWEEARIAANSFQQTAANSETQFANWSSDPNNDTYRELREMFGGEIAAKMIEQADALTDPWGYADLRGAENLRVGGEGMKAFYDRNLVNIANDLIKKYGGKVEPVGLHEDADHMAEKIAFNEKQLEKLKRGELPRRNDMTLEETIALAEQQLAAMKQGSPHPGFIITPELAKAAAAGLPLFQNTGAPRGQASFAPDITSAPSIISMLRGADLSTFLHESGHFFLEVLTHVASQPNAPQEVLDDMRTILRYAGVDSLSKWQQMSTEERRVHHETFARSFEAYLFEGKAPSLEMRSLFQRFRSWLVSVYRDIKRLNVNLTDEVRGVFDRMLASDEQIAEAEADRGMAPLFAQKPDEMTDAEWADYQKLGLAATAEASSELERRSLRDMRFADNAGSRELKRLQRSVREKRKAVREEVAADVRRDPVYRAIEYLRTGKLDGETTDDAMKLSIEAVDKLYADKTDAERKAIKKQLGYGGNGMLAKKGADPAEVANLFGFTSGDHLIQELLLAPPINDAIEQQTEQLMRERYGDITSNDALQAATDLAIHNEVRGRFVATELAALSKAPGKRRVLNEAAKRIAHDMINRLRIRDVRPGQYEAAERRAAKEAQEAGGTKLAEAAAAKRNQLVQFHAAKEAREALAEIERGLSYLKRFGTDAAKKAISPEYMDQIEALLERFDLRRSTPLKAAQKRKTLLEWVERQRELGFEPAIDDRLLEEAQRTPYREMAVEEWRGLIDTIRNIEHLGRLKKTLLTSKAKRELNAAAEDIGSTIRVNAFKSVPEIVGAKTWWEGLRSGVADFFAMHRKLANVARTMDGKNGGVVWEYFIRPMNAAGDQETLMNADATKKLGEIFKLLDKDTAKRVMVPEIGKSLSLEDRLMVALNWGNSTNRQRVADGDKWTPAQVEAILAPLTSQHWDFVEAIWRHIDSYWPQIEAKERRVSGVVPEKVEAEPFTHKLPDGSERVISGGYFPIKYDPDRSSKAAGDDQAEELRQRLQGGYTQSTTRRGHIKARVETVERPVRKDFGVIFGHVTQVIHDLSWHEYLIDANRLLRHNQVDSAVREHYGPATLKWMRKALEDIAVGDIPAQNALERAVNHIRTGVTVAGLGWNLWTSLLQPLGLSQSIVRIGPKWVARGIGDLLGNPAKLNEKLAWIYEVSPMMRMRGQTLQREINEIRNKVVAKSPLKQGFAKLVPEPMRAAVQDSFFVLIAKAQLMADLPTWVGQYEKALAEGEGADRAIALADQAVLDSQGGGQIKDLAGVQRGGPVWKLWTNFYSYFSTTYNMVADRIAGTRRVGAKDLPLLAVDVLLLTALPATVAALIRGALMGDDKDELLARVAGDNISYWLGMLIGVRETAAAVSGNAGYNGPAGARLLAELNKLGQQVRQGEADAPLVRAVNNVAGIILHYPAGQIDRTVRGIGAMNRGEAGPMAPLIGPPPAHH